MLREHRGNKAQCAKGIVLLQRASHVGHTEGARHSVQRALVVLLRRASHGHNTEGTRHSVQRALVVLLRRAHVALYLVLTQIR